MTSLSAKGVVTPVDPMAPVAPQGAHGRQGAPQAAVPTATAVHATHGHVTRGHVGRGSIQETTGKDSVECYLGARMTELLLLLWIDVRVKGEGWCSATTATVIQAGAKNWFRRSFRVSKL